MSRINPVQDQLKSMYSKWKTAFDRSEVDVEAFSPPLLLSASDDFVNAKRKVFVFGQETFCLDRRYSQRVDKPSEGFVYSDLHSLDDFLQNDDSIDALLWGYEQFAFANHHPAGRSPFWRAFRQLGQSADVELLWTNVIKCDYKGGTILRSPPKERVSFLKQQNELVLGEMEIIAPEAAVFFSGPYYDDFLHEIFPGLKIEIVEGERMLSRLHHPNLPVLSFRTYHPRYLSLAKLWKHIDYISGKISQ